MRHRARELGNLASSCLALVLLIGGAAMAATNSKVTICHRPPDNPDNYRTLTVGGPALADHLGHGDLVGACLDNCEALCGAAPDMCTTVTGTPNDLTGRCECSSAPRSCDDGEACTLDSCDPLTGCVNTPVPGCVVGTQAFDIRREPTRLKESAMGNMVADAQRWKYPAADIALMNSGGLRADILCLPASSGEGPCEITWGEVFSVLPFGNRSALLTITGAQLEAALLNGLSPACNPSISTGRFPQVSGLVVDFTCNGTLPVVTGMWKAPQGTFGPLTPIGPADTLRLVTNDFVAAGGDGYTVFQPIPAEMGEGLLPTVVAYIRAFSPVAPVVEGRIVKN